MKNIYEKWDQRTNPPVTLMTNNYVNYYSGVSILQTTPSASHTLPNSFEGKKFHINSQGTSTNPVTVFVNTRNGLQRFDIIPGDSGVFVYTGTGLWDVISEDATNSGTSSSISRVIQFNTIPDSGPARFIIGTIPVTATAYEISVEISTAFNDTVADSLSVEAGGFTILTPSEVDIKQTGTYTVVYPASTAPANGLVEAIFNTIPNAAGGTQGIAGIIVEFIAG